MPCAHFPDVTAPLALQGVRVNVVERIDERCHGGACYWPSRREIDVERSTWARLDDLQRTAVMAHEIAHAEGLICEHCADERAGALMAQVGFSPRGAVQALQSVVSSRPVASKVLRGYERMRHAKVS